MKLLRAVFDWRPTKPMVLCRETAQLEPSANNLFQRVYGTSGPSQGRHFVLEHKGTKSSDADLLGYVNFRAYKTGYLAGGLVVDAWRYRELEPVARSHIKEHGGMAEMLMRYSVGSVSPCTAVYAYIGDKASETVNLRVGFVRISGQYLFILNPKGASQSTDVDALTEDVASLGPF